jgi:curved DNA-binding protein CbpA
MVRVPRPVPGCDVKSLPLRTDEAYLLSRIDSVVSERELALITGMSQAEVTTALDRLFVLGAIDFSEPKAPVSRRGGASGSIIPPASRSFDPPPSRRFDPQPDTPPPSRRSYESLSDPPPPTRRSIELMGERRGHDASTERRGLDLGADTAAPMSRRGIDLSVDHPRIVDSDAEDPADIDHQKKKKILDLYNALDDRTHYEMLGVAAEADKKQIKAAYYALAPEYHPDKYFRKRLGNYKQKIEAIFTRLTLAHDVLTSKQRRAEYDAYLEQTRRNRTMAALLEHDPSDVPAVVAASEEGPPSGSSMPGRFADADASGPESRRRPPFARITQGVRTRPADAPGGAASVAPTTPPAPAGMGEPARPRFDPHRRMQLERYVLAAKVALERKDLAAAANAYRLAVGLAPEDAELKHKLAEVQQQAATELAEGFLKQAEYEASQGRWAEAALSYANVCPGRPDDPRPHERVAFCTLKTGQNARRAIDYARRAVRLAPQSAEYRLTLARAYMAAGLETSARVEMERAAELSPNDARMREAIAQLRVQMKRTESSEQ